MTTESQTDAFRDSLSGIEQQCYDQFIKTEGKRPESMWQLMQYNIVMQQQANEHSKFWKGVFGL